MEKNWDSWKRPDPSKLEVEDKRSKRTKLIDALSQEKRNEIPVLTIEGVRCLLCDGFDNPFRPSESVTRETPLTDLPYCCSSCRIKLLQVSYEHYTEIMEKILFELREESGFLNQTLHWKLKNLELEDKGIESIPPELIKEKDETYKLLANASQNQYEAQREIRELYKDEMQLREEQISYSKEEWAHDKHNLAFLHDLLYECLSPEQKAWAEQGGEIAEWSRAVPVQESRFREPLSIGSSAAASSGAPLVKDFGAENNAVSTREASRRKPLSFEFSAAGSSIFQSRKGPGSSRSDLPSLSSSNDHNTEDVDRIITEEPAEYENEDGSDTHLPGSWQS